MSFVLRQVKKEGRKNVLEDKLPPSDAAAAAVAVAAASLLAAAAAFSSCRNFQVWR